MKKLFIITILLFLPFIIKAKIVEFYDGFMYAELKGRYSKNTNFPNKLNEGFQQIEMKMRLYIATNVEGYALFKSEYVQFHWKKENRYFLVNSLGVKYIFNPVTELKLGSMTVNYSPYLLFAYAWFTDIFRGIEFKLDRNDLTIQAFIANNGEDPDEASWLENLPTFNTNVNYTYNKIDLGYNQKGVIQTFPTIWAGAHFRKAFGRKESLFPALQFYYLFENYQIDNKPELYSQVYKNHYGAVEADLLLLNWINADLLYSTCLRSYAQYSIQSHYFGTNTYLYTLNNNSIKKPHAIALSGRIDDFFGSFLGTHNLSIEGKYESIDRDYNPIYMEGNIFDKRSLTLPETSTFSGRKRISVILMQDLIGGLAAGIGYSKYELDYTTIEKSIRASLILSKMFRLQARYYRNTAEKGTFPEGLSKIDSYYLLYEGDIIDNIFFVVEYGQNINYYKNYSQLIVKLMMWGW